MMDQCDIEELHRVGLFDATWYTRRYPDVARQTLDPMTHFALIGAKLARDPGPGFSSRYYLETNPDVADAGLVPVVHYLRTGRAEGRLPHPPVTAPLSKNRTAQLTHLRSLLETGGLTAEPLKALSELAMQKFSPEANGAAEALAFWALRQGDGVTALRWISWCLELSGGDQAHRRLAPMQLIALCMAGDKLAARCLYDTTPCSSDLILAATWLDREPTARVETLNKALSLYGLASLKLDNCEAPALDRLQSSAPPEGTCESAPLVTILLAAHQAKDTIRSALQSLLGQTWQALEIIVIDDGSQDGTSQIVKDMCARDYRIRLISLPKNSGAYAARNVGLSQARGEYITLHDADDWSHPERISRQIQYLRNARGYVGCLSRQIRCTSCLRLNRWTGTGATTFESLPSLMLPKEVLCDCLGGWDTVRVSSDSELLRRVRKLFGEGAVPILDDGPLTFQRDHDASATADSATGMDWFYYGARREYFESQLAFHQKGRRMFYSPLDPRPFPAPAILSGDQSLQRPDHVYAGILSQDGSALEKLDQWLDEDISAGRTGALVPLYSMEQPTVSGLAIHPRIRARIDGKTLSVLCYGERARCLLFRRLPEQRITEEQRYLPEVYEGNRKVLSPGFCPDGAVLSNKKGHIRQNRPYSTLN